MGVPLVGPVNINVGCCEHLPGTYPPDIAPYVVSLNDLSGILTLANDGGVSIRSSGGTIYIGADGTAGLGTVTSVGIASTTLSVAGSPITTAGSITVNLSGGTASIQGLTTAADKMIYTTASDTYAVTDLTAFARTLLDDANAAAARVTLGLVIGTNVQAFSQDLTDFVTNASWSGTALTLAGNLILNSNLTVSGDASIGDDLTVTDQITADSLNVTNGVIAATLAGEGSNLTGLSAANISTGTLAVARGGTGLASYAIGDIIYASGTTTLSKLADIATGNVLRSGGVGTAPNWGKVTAAHTTGLAASGTNSDITVMAALSAVSSPNVEIQGNIELLAALKDVNSSAGVAGQLLKSIGTAAEWTDDIVADTLRIDGTLSTEGTITGAGTTGAQTINKLSGTVRFAAATTSLVVTNSICTTSHRVLATVVTNDATLKSVSAVPTTGAFTLNANAAATGEVECFWMLVGIT